MAAVAIWERGVVLRSYNPEWAEYVQGSLGIEPPVGQPISEAFAHPRWRNTQRVMAAAWVDGMTRSIATTSGTIVTVARLWRDGQPWGLVTYSEPGLPAAPSRPPAPILHVLDRLAETA